MLWGIAVTLISLWMLGLMTGYTMGNATHLLPVVAIIAMLIKIEDECSEYGTGHARKRYLKKQLLNRSGKIMPALAILSEEQVSRPIISPQGCRET